MIDPLTLCLAAMLSVEAGGEIDMREKVAMIQTAQSRQRINAEYPNNNYFAGGSTNLCDIVTHRQWYGPGGWDMLLKVEYSDRFYSIVALVEFVLTHELPLIADGAPCFRTARGTKDAVVVNKHEFGWYCMY